MKVKTDELTDLALNWAVAKAIGEYKPVAVPHYSTNWSQGGPIIERERITLDGTAIRDQWMAVFYVPDEEPWEMRGPTPLIAAMRCFVASKLGDEIEVPEELK
jgi:hypothetical protein